MSKGGSVLIRFFRDKTGEMALKGLRVISQTGP